MNYLCLGFGIAYETYYVYCSDKKSQRKSILYSCCFVKVFIRHTIRYTYRILIVILFYKFKTAILLFKVSYLVDILCHGS